MACLQKLVIDALNDSGGLSLVALAEETGALSKDITRELQGLMYDGIVEQRRVDESNWVAFYPANYYYVTIGGNDEGISRH